MNRFSRHIILLTILITAILNFSCSDMYSDMLEGTKLRVGILFTYSTGGIQAFLINKDDFPESRNDLFPSYTPSNIFTKALSLDYDNDGDCDIALLENTGDLRILLNDGKGRFNEFFQETNIPSTTLNMAAADFNHDGKPDFAIILSGSTNIYIYTYPQPFLSYSTTGGSLTTSITTGDINGDGLVDIFVGVSGGSSQPHYFINTSSGSISFNGLNIPSSLASNSTSLVDIDNDGDKDLVLSRSPTSIDIFKNDGTGNFSFFHTPSIVMAPDKITPGDLNNDRFIDLVIGNAVSGSDIFINNGTGIFTNTHLAINISEAKLFDIDFDGDLDIIARNSSQLVIMKNDGSGNFTLHSSTPVTTPTSITVFTYEED